MPASSALCLTAAPPSSETTLRILIADDHVLIRQGLRLLIEEQPGWSVCGEASTGREAVALAEELRPDIVVMDMTMPELNGLEATRSIKRRLPKTEVLMFTGYESEELVRDIFDAGARSYILKTDVMDQLVSAVRALAMHKSFFTTKTGEIIFAKFLPQNGATSKDVPPGPLLSPREQETLQLLVQGKSNKEAATALGISVKTVETHRAAVMRKLELKSFSEMVRYAIRNNIIPA